MRLVDYYVLLKTGVSIHDLDDYGFRDAYDKGRTPKSVCNSVIRLAKKG